MRHRVKRLMLRVLGIIAIVLITAAAYTGARWKRVHEAPYPEIRATAAPEMIERGKYLVYGPAHCSACHAPPALHPALDRGEDVPLIGGYEWKLPIGVVRSPNITNDPVTGIGRYTDPEIARVIRHSVKPDGTAMLPFMELQNLSDEDLTAVISYLRSAPPVHNEVPRSELNFIGRAVMATVMRPQGPASAPPTQSPPAEETLQRGEYLANRVAGCAACHSPRNMMDGSYIGPRFSGGTPTSPEHDPGVLLVPPNLTPDPSTGHIHAWTADQFVTRFRIGRLIEGSHMPWSSYGRMTDADLRAIYEYLRTLDPVENDVGPLWRTVP